MTANKVVVWVTDEPRNGVELKVTGTVLKRTVVTSRDNWDDLIDRLDPETRKVIFALKRYSAVQKVVINDHNVITITNDCDRSRIEDAVAAALQAELMPYAPPAPRLRRRGLRERYSDFIADYR